MSRGSGAAGAAQHPSAGTRTRPARIASYGCAGRLSGRAVDDDLARRGAPLAAEHVEQRVLALALQRGDADDLARPRTSKSTPLGRSGRRSAALACSSAALPGAASVSTVGDLARRLRRVRFSTRAANRSRDLRAEHQLDQPLLPPHGAARAGPPLGRRAARWPDRTGALTSARRCEMNRTERPFLRKSSDDPGDGVGEVGGQRRGDLVQEEQPRIEGKRAGQIEHPQRRQRQIRD